MAWHGTGWQGGWLLCSALTEGTRVLAHFSLQWLWVDFCLCVVVVLGKEVIKDGAPGLPLSLED